MSHRPGSFEEALYTMPLWKVATIIPAMAISVTVILITLIPYLIGALIVNAIHYLRGEEKREPYI